MTEPCSHADRQHSLVGDVVQAFFDDTSHVWSGERQVIHEVPPGITLVTGPSGCGKSAMLQHVESLDGSWRRLPHLEEDTPLVDQFTGTLASRISLLARFGLGDAQVLIRPASWLSDGQLFRARLAAAVHSGYRRLLVDEFLSTVDREGAAVVAHNLQRLCRRDGIDLLVATAHEDIEASLDPDLVIRVRANDTPRLIERAPSGHWPLSERISVQVGALSDYLELQRFHYYSELDFDPAARDVTVISATLDNRPIAARLYCAPYPHAWTADLPEFAAVNRELTLGQRLVVHPAFRGIGLARRITDARFAPRPLTYVRSVMSRYTDMHSTLGFTRHEPLTNSLSAQMTGSAQVDAVRALSMEYADYRCVMGGPILASEVQKVARWFTARLRSLTEEQLAASTKVTVMGGYILRRPQSSGER